MELYQESFDFGEGPLSIDNLESNVDVQRLKEEIQSNEVVEPKVTLEDNQLHKSTYNRYKINKKARYSLKNRFKIGEIKLEGVGTLDFDKYYYKYLNKKSKRTSKIRKSQKRNTNVKQRQKYRKELSELKTA